MMVDVKISHQLLSKQLLHQPKVLTKLFKNVEKSHGLPNGCELTIQNTFHKTHILPYLGKFIMAEVRKLTLTLTLTLPETINLPVILTLTLQAYCGEIP